MGQIIDGAFYSDYDSQDIDRRLAIAGGVSNPNLLDNPWFTVNQRGATSGTTNGYIADRWVTNYGSGGIIWSRTANTITIQPASNNSYVNIQQRLEQSLVDELAGKIVTLSVMLSDYSIRSISNTFNWFRDNWRSLGNGIDGNALLIRFSSSNGIELRKNYTAETIRAVKLELGSVSTLANDVAPDYGLELAKCQRYFVRIKMSANYSAVGLGVCTTNDMVAIYMSKPYNMRPITSINYSGSLKAYALNLSANYDVSNVTLGNGTTNNIPVLFSAVGTTAGTMYFLRSNNDANAYIDLIADL